MSEYALHHFENGEVRDRTHSANGFHKNISIINNSGRDIMVIDRAGLPLLVDTASSNDSGITVEVTYYLGYGVYPDPHNTFYNNCGSDWESKCIKKLLDLYKDKTINKSRVMSKSFYFKIENEAFKRLGKSLYLVELDLLITTDVTSKHVKHPYSIAQTRVDKIKKDTDGDVDCFNKKMMIVSNNKTEGDRYINIHGEVYKIPSIVNHSLKDGFYIDGSSAVSSEVSVEDSNEVIPIEEADVKYRLYKTYNEANREGDIADKYALELAKANERLEAMKREAREAEIKHKAQQILLEKEMEARIHKYKIDELNRRQIEEERKDWYDARTIHRKDKYELISLDRKDYYEDKSAGRKDVYEGASIERKSNYEATSVGLKTGASIGAALPVIVGGLAAVIGLVIKFFK